MLRTILLLIALVQALPFPGPGAASGASRVFNGTSAELTTANGYLGSSAAFTILEWVKLTNTAQTNTYLQSTYKSGSSEQASVIYGFVAGKIEFFSSGHTGTDPRTGSQISIGDTSWHYVGYRYNGTKWEYNLDGTWTTINATITFALSGAGLNSFVIGSAGSGSGAWIAASVDDVRIYTSAISDGDAALAKLCQATSATPVGWWLMTGASPEPDSGSGNHSLTVTNATVGSGAPCS